MKQRKAPDAQPAGAVIPGLEPSVVTAARAAGISDAQLRRMGALAGQPTALNDGKTKRRSGPLSESEESEGGEEALQGGEGQTPSDAVGKAVVQMSKILAKMHASKKSELDELLTEGPEAWEARQTKLLDPRIFAVLIHRIREREAFLEARKKLTGHHQSAADPAPRVTDSRTTTASLRAGPREIPGRERRAKSRARASSCLLQPSRAPGF